MQAEDYDVLIVGSGASGGMAAYALTRMGVRCLMLEAGPPATDRTFETKPVYELPFRGFGDPGKVPHVFQANEGNENQWANERDHPYTHPPENPYNWVRVRMIGGKSNYWSRMSFRLSDYEFKARDFDGFGENWPIDHAELAPYYARVEPIFRVTGRTEGFRQLPDGVFIERPQGDEGPGTEKLLRVLSDRGIPNTITRSSSGQNGQASSANLLIPPALETGNLTIVPNAIVRELTVDPNTGRVDGANFVDRHSHREMHARARVVVLGAACLESTRILLNSGIANSSGVLGRYLHDQFYITNSLWAVMPEVMDGSAPDGYTRGGNGYIPRFRNLQPDENRSFIRGYALQWSLGGSPGRDYFPGWGEAQEREAARYRGAGFTATAMGEVLPRHENRVTIDPDVRDAWGIPALHFDCRYTDNELNMAQDAIRVMEELADACGWETIARRPEMFPPGYSIHELGTCRMGDDPRTSVLNRWNQSHDIPNLFVVDGSSFVTGGYQNPTMTILALSMRASEYLADQMRAGEI